MSGYGAFPKVKINGVFVEQKANPVVDCSKDPGFTSQADREDADINKIVARFEKSAGAVRLNAREPFYGDVSELGDLADSIAKVKKAEDLFMTYNANVRERFDNDPVKFVEFFENPDNTQDAIDLGLAVARPIPPSPVPEPVK